MKINKKILLILTVALGTTLFAGCEYEKTADSIQEQQTNQLMTEMNSQIGMPNITNFYEKKMAKEIFELRDDSKLVCYAYTKNEMTGKYVYEGKCMGYGLPYSTQYTNPERIAKESSYGIAVLPQADPNGLFSATGLSATWLMMIDEETGKRSAEYYEPNIVVTQHKKPKRLCETWSLPKNY
jgi:hypothetical protein